MQEYLNKMTKKQKIEYEFIKEIKKTKTENENQLSNLYENQQELYLENSALSKALKNIFKQLKNDENNYIINEKKHLIKQLEENTKKYQKNNILIEKLEDVIKH